ncbi:PWP2 [Bugula neritina]|uniref:PWP2 n=1 Tax=Bugula neritina TaxID=10212 RepID=A0A7J7K3R8_BUGNE|nr:PWP2 [Bugula neritina]
MKFSYKFSNLLGTVYKKGNLVFSPDGNVLISPVGNRISAFDLKNNKSETLPLESKLNITTVGLSPNGNLMLLVNEEGEGYLCSLLNKSIISRYHFSQPINCVQFSPDGRKFAVTKGNNVLLFQSPGYSKTFNPFILLKTFYGAYDELTCIDWTSDSRVLCVGSNDMNTRIYGAEKLDQLVIYSMGGHRDAIVGSFFLNNSLDVISVSHDRNICYWKSTHELSQLTSSSKKDEEEEKVKYIKKAVFSLNDAIAKRAEESSSRSYCFVSAVTFHKQTGILVTGLTDGSFYLHEMPSFTHILSLSLGDQAISTISFNSTGDWLAVGCSESGQLVVWEWQSETYIMKQQGHFDVMSCVKVWNSSNGFCFVTFTEHTGGITGVTFTKNGKSIVSSSLDGTVRAFDLHRYRNFRTFTSPRQVQFGCLAVDPSGELVCAGGRDVFDIFVWSIQTGKLLEILAGHEAPVPSLSFSPVAAILVSVSWDSTVKVWDVFDSKGNKESIQLSSDGMAVAHRADGRQIAVATLRGAIIFFNTETCSQEHSIEARADLGYVRKASETVSAKKASASNTFTCLAYSADGKSILAAGQSPYVCIFSIQDQALLKKFKITQNLSMDGIEEFLDKRKMTEAGNVDQVETRDETMAGLPGVRTGDLSLRRDRPELRVSSVSFSPTGRSWAATSTEGVLIYSLDSTLTFDPFEFGMEVTPEVMKKALAEREYSMALLLALRLNVTELIQEALESTPLDQITVVVWLGYVQCMLPCTVTSLFWFEIYRHVMYFECYNTYACVLFTTPCRCDYNKYTMQYILSTSHAKDKLSAMEDEMSHTSSNIHSEEE